MKTVGKWVLIGLGGVLALSVVVDMFAPDVVVVAEPSTTTTTIQETARESTTTTTIRPTTTTTTTKPAPPTTRRTTTTASGEWTQAQWNEAAVLVLGLDEVFDGWTDADILEAIDLVCEQAYEPAYSGGDDFVLAIALSGDVDFGLRVAAILGTLQIAPGCGNDFENQFADEGFKFLEGFS
jgi:hypothetical protein